MDKQQAIKIISDTFEKPFDKPSFAYFIKNLLNKIDESKELPTIQGAYIKESFRDYVKSYERIGTYTDPAKNKIDILIVNLQKGTTLERARTAQRNFIARYLKDRGEKEAGLVAFVAPDPEDWRFSFVKMDYKFDDKGKIKEEFTPARRYSYLVGKHEASHTAQSRMLSTLTLDDENRNPTLAQIEELFSVEKATKEFFEKYRELFIKVKEALDDIVKANPAVKKDFTAKGVDTVNFSKKLLGQIVFLYFLQKKGWFGVEKGKAWGTGSKHFLRDLFAKKATDYKNFFNNILEPLFYEALRNDRSHDDYYYRLFECKIPFLNGGLFDPINNYDWVNTDIELPNELFSNNIKTKEGDIGNGILDIFDRYNFTVKEDEPLEKEVAIDPELLGKAYEKFNAIRPDNFEEYKKALRSGEKGAENQFNKQYGVYYTPREIVHYMCKESLINYLDTELNTGTTAYEKLGDKQTDAFGNKAKKGQLDLTVEHKSGLSIPKEDIETLIKYGEQLAENEALVEAKGKETETYSYKLSEGIRKNAQLIDEKLANIYVCDPAVGSGAFPVGMMHEIVKTRNVLSKFIKDNNRTIYHFKRECIEKSLYGVDIDTGAVEIAKLRLWLSLIVDEEDIKKIRPLPNLDYKIVCGNSLLGVTKDMFNQPQFNELERLKPLYLNETNPTKKQENKKQIDALIMNITNGHKEFDFEVYFSEVFHKKNGFDIVIANPPYGSNIDDYVKVFRAVYPETTVAYKDIYKLFFDVSLSKILRNKGILTFITPNTFLLQPRYCDLRKFLLKYQINAIINLGENVFDAVVPTAITIVIKNNLAKNILGFADLTNLSKYTGDINNISFNKINQQSYTATPSNIFVENYRSKNKNEEFLGDILKFKDAGINYQRVNVGLSDKGNSNLSERLLYEGKKEKDSDVEFWKGTDIDSYFTAHKTNRFVRTNIKLKNNERVILNKEYFGSFPKLIWRQTASYPIAAIDYKGIWFGRSIQSGILNIYWKGKIEYEYLLALLNSNYLRFLYAKNVQESGRVFPQVKLEKIRPLPIKIISPKEQKPFVCLVDKILAITKPACADASAGRDNDYLDNPVKQAKVKKYEAEIDQMVYTLYDLTPEEIKIVEGVNKK